MIKEILFIIFLIWFSISSLFSTLQQQGDLYSFLGGLALGLAIATIIYWHYKSKLKDLRRRW